MTAKEYLQQLERADVIIEQKMKEQADLEELSKCVRAIDYGKDRVSSSGTGDAPFVNPVLKIVMLEQEINAEIDKYVDLKRKITGEIQSLQDPQFIDNTRINGTAENLALGRYEVPMFGGASA